MSKFCINCINFKDIGPGSQRNPISPKQRFICLRKTGEPDLVTGQCPETRSLCYTERYSEDSNACGKHGKFFVTVHQEDDRIYVAGK